MIEPATTLGLPPIRQFSVKVTWLSAHKGVEIIRSKTHRVTARHLIEAVSAGLKFHQNNVCTAVQASWID